MMSDEADDRTTTDDGEAHLPWSELAAGHALSCLDAPADARYLAHAKDCEQCQQIESELSAVVAELAFAATALQPPPSLKASIMEAVVKDAGQPAVVDRPVFLAGRRSRRTARRGLPNPVRAAAAAVVVLVVVGTGIFIRVNSHSSVSVADRCAKVKCLTAQLTASGRAVATVMVLDGTAWVDAPGLPATPVDSSYVLWRIRDGKPVAVAAFRSTPTEGPVKAGPVSVPVAQVSGLAISQEHGKVAPAAPSDVLAQGVVSS